MEAGLACGGERLEAHLLVALKMGLKSCPGAVGCRFEVPFVAGLAVDAGLTEGLECKGNSFGIADGFAGGGCDLASRSDACPEVLHGQVGVPWSADGIFVFEEIGAGAVTVFIFEMIENVEGSDVGKPQDVVAKDLEVDGIDGVDELGLELGE